MVAAIVSQLYPKLFFDALNYAFLIVNKRLASSNTPDLVHLRDDADVGKKALRERKKVFLDQMERFHVDAHRVAQRLENKWNAGVRAAHDRDAFFDLLSQRIGRHDDLDEHFLLDRGLEKGFVLFIEGAVAGARRRLQVHRDDVAPTDHLLELFRKRAVRLKVSRKPLFL